MIRFSFYLFNYCYWFSYYVYLGYIWFVSSMNFDTSQDVDKHKPKSETEEYWRSRCAFLTKYKNEYPEDRLVNLAQIFIKVKFFGLK